MSLLDLSKEQKQRLILGVIVAIVLVVLVAFGIKVSLSSISEAKAELQDLTGKVKAAEKSLSKTQRDDAVFRETITELTGHLANIPPDRNYYSWATEIIYSKARGVRFEIDAIDEIGTTTAGYTSKKKGTVELESYSLRITAHGGYDNVKRFLQQIALDHPLVRVTGIEISTGSKPDVHDVQLFIEWPFNLGYITEAWKNIDVQPPRADNLAVQSMPPSEPTKLPGTEPTDPKKKPVPPPPRTESAPKPVQTEPIASGESIESDGPVAGDESGKSDNQLEALLTQ